MSNDLLAIGAFSRASSISVNTLRSYHELGLLVPAVVDAKTGYRSYTVDQLADAVVVVRLRALDVPLPQVKEIIEAKDPERTRTILAAHQAAMRDRLAETERIIAELQHGLAPVTHTPIHVRRDDALHTVRITGDVGADLPGWLGRAHSRLQDAVERAGATAIGPPSALYEAEIGNDDFEHVEAIYTIAAPFLVPAGFGDVTIGEIPAQTTAVLVHPGPFDTIGDTYRALGAWVARHAEPSGAQVCERYVVNADDTPDESAWRTEIAWPIVSG